jgi:hypothetical protein
MFDGDFFVFGDTAGGEYCGSDHDELSNAM